MAGGGTLTIILKKTAKKPEILNTEPIWVILKAYNTTHNSWILLTSGDANSDK